jgi:acylaminoacyl-peptidase
VSHCSSHVCLIMTWRRPPQVESLFGKVGSQDVADMKTAVEEALKANEHLDPSRVGACGGSHGGFLSLHLVGQHGDVFKAAAVRNPVTNIATMYGATDIPDWCYTESGSAPTYAQPDAGQYSKALEMSPMAHVSKITSPVMLLVGGDDRRVPPFQSKEFYYALKERGAQVEMLWYDKHTHGLAETPKGEGDGLVNICYFFQKHL